MHKQYKKDIDETCHKYKDSIAFSCLNSDNSIVCISYIELLDEIKEFKKIVRKYNLTSGDRIGLATRNNYYASIAFLCATYNHLTVAIIDCNASKPQQLSQLKAGQCKVLMSDEKLYKEIYSDVRLPVLDVRNNFVQLNKCKVKTKLNDINKDAWAIIFSSGTAGKLKPVLIPYCVAKITSDINVRNADPKAIDGDTLCVFPINHLSGLALILSIFYVGARTDFVDEFSLKDIPRAIKTFEPNLFGMAPKVLEVMNNTLQQEIEKKSKILFCYYSNLLKLSSFLQSKGIHYSRIRFLFKPFFKHVYGKNIRTILIGSTKCNYSTIKSFYDMGINCMDIYASTECGCPITSNNYLDKYPYDNEGNIKSNPEIKIKLINKDEDGIGEILVKSKMMMLGYFNDSKLTKSSFTSDGYFKTGDLGTIDKDNYLRILGRAKEVIILANGKKMSPTDLETLLSNACPKNNDVIVCGFDLNSNGYDEIYCFFEDKAYSLKQKKLIENNLLSYVRKNNLHPIKRIIFVDNIPKTAVGKIKRNELIQYIKNNDETKNDKTRSPLDYIQKLVNKQSETNLKIKENMLLSELGLDSLRMYSICTDIQNKYNVDVLSILNEKTKIKDVLNLIKHNNHINSSSILRPMKKSEYKQVAKLLAASFCDYPLYQVMFKEYNTKQIEEYLRLFYEIDYLTDYKNTYVNDDISVVCNVARPGKKLSHFNMLTKPFLLLKNGIHFPKKKIFTLIKYVIDSKPIMNKYYNPDTDSYGKIIAIDKNNRNGNLFIQAVNEVYDGSPIYIETHSKTDMLLYKKMGFKLMETWIWQGVECYFMKKY